MVVIASMAAASVLLSTQNAVASINSVPPIAETDIEEAVEAGNATTTPMMTNQTTADGNMTGTNSTT